MWGPPHQTLLSAIADRNCALSLPQPSFLRAAALPWRSDPAWTELQQNSRRFRGPLHARAILPRPRAFFPIRAAASSERPLNQSRKPRQSLAVEIATAPHPALPTEPPWRDCWHCAPIPRTSGLLRGYIGDSRALSSKHGRAPPDFVNS